MTKTLANLLALIVRGASALLPRWKRLTVRARVFDRLQPFERVHLGRRDIWLYVPDRTSVYWVRYGPDSEPVTNAWIAAFAPDDVLIDVGANVGLYALMAGAHGISKVYAIEANPFSFEALARNIARNGMGAAIVPLCLAVSDRPALVTFKLSGTHAGSIGNEIAVDGGDSGFALETPACSLDRMIESGYIAGATHLKIDIDGLEYDVLKGAERLLAGGGIKSVLIEDSGDDAERARVEDLMHANGYRLSEVFGTQPNYSLYTKNWPTA